MKDLKGHVLRGSIVRVGSQALIFMLRLSGLVVLARLLEPADFGLVAMVTAFTGIINRFNDFGLSTVTVQRPAITSAQVSSLFWLNILIGSFFFVVSISGAPLLAAFYKEPRLIGVATALAAGFILTALGVQHSALLQRQMRFVTLAIIDISSLVVSITTGISLAMIGYGYWALVGMAIMLPAFSTGCLWYAAKWIPSKPSWEPGMPAMIRFGGTVTLNSIIVYIAYNADKILLGRYWGPGVLGFYERAYQLINIPADNLNSAIGGVAFPALAKLQDDPDRLKSYFLKGYSLVLGLSFPITAACALYAEEIIYIFLGAKWLDAVPIFRMLSPIVFICAMINPLSWLLFSVGLVGRSLKIAAVLAPLVIGAYLMGLPYGAFGVAAGYSTVMVLWLMPHIVWCTHGTVITLKDICVSVSKPLLSAMIASCAALAFKAYIGPYVTSAMILVTGILLLLMVYLFMLLYVLNQRAFYFQLLNELKFRAMMNSRA